jgi:hypothetical protein
LLLSLALTLALTGTAHADPAATRDALERLEEVLQLRVEDGLLDLEAVTPAIVVSVSPRYSAPQEWYAVGVIEVLSRALGEGSLRLCEACMAPRAFVEEGRLTWSTGPAGLEEIALLDAGSRGDAAPARAAIWVDEQPAGVSARIVDLRTGQVLFAQNIDPQLVEYRNSERLYTLSEELERRARGDSITQSFVDLAVYPGQHISLDWTDQWGPTNANLSGFTLSLFDPVVGIGASHYRATPLYNTLVGGKLLVSLPTAAVRALGQEDDVLDPLLTLVGVVRVPFGRSNYGGVLTVSTNGMVGIGVSLLNISLVPVIP